MSKTWQPFTQMKDWNADQQLYIHSAKGNYLYTEDGTSYLDGTASLWTNVHGHNHPILNKAIVEQLSKVAHTTLLGLGSPLVDRLSEELTRRAPEGLQHVFYSDSGSTAVEIALKQAFQYWQLIGHPKKTKFVHLDQSYHGDTLGAVAVGGIDIFHQVYGPLLVDTLSVPHPNAYHHKSANAQTAMRASLDAVDTLFKNKSENIAGFILEPLVQGAGGMLVHPKGYLSQIASLCKKYNVLLIVDEVATGFGRTGTFFACEQEHVNPDFMCLAKGITGGYLPLAATLSTDKIFDAFLAPRADAKSFFHGHTYTGNALACAAALASLTIFDEEETIKNLAPKIRVLNDLLVEVGQHEHVGNVRQCGMMIGIELTENKEKRRAYPANHFVGHNVCMEARNHGVIIRNLGDVLVLMPPLSITIEEIKTLVEITLRSINTIT